MHADFETPGVIGDWFSERNQTMEIRKPYKGENLNDISEFDFLIVMGGPQSPLETDKFPYLNDEISAIKKALRKNMPILGFCLGAQLIGEALGAKTERSPEKEIGVYPIEIIKEDPLLKTWPKSVEVIHWHNDMPGLTKESVVLAKSAGCPRQIVKYRDQVYGFQCHLEITVEGIKTMIEACPQDLKPSRFTQSKVELLGNDYDGINRRMFDVLDFLFG
jgi:GMP synthase (glutamine-hydrolysing)